MFRSTMLATVAGLGLALGAGAAQAQIKVGAAGPMTGEYASFGAQLKNGAEQAVADINKAGGVLGQQLQLSIGDDACDPRQAVSVANQFASQGVKFADGHFCSGSSIPASKVYTEEGIVQITPASTNPDFTDKGSWNTFRLCGRDDQQGQVAGGYIAEHYKSDKVAVLNDNTAYGKGLADETQKTMEAKGVKPAMVATYTPGEKDYSALVSRMKAAGIQVIYIGGYHTEAGLIIRQAKEQGMNPTLISGDALVTKEFWQIAGPAGEGTMMTFAPDLEKRPGAAAVVKAFKDKNIEPEGYTLYSYAAMQVWAEAAKKAGTTDARKVAAALHDNGPWQSIIGPITFNKKGDVEGPSYVFYVWKNGSYAEM
jgi:branched-chain amino acid transport system substrate-binding protein